MLTYGQKVWVLANCSIIRKRNASNMFSIRWFKIHAGVILYGGPKASSLLNIPQARSLHHEYCSLACTVEIVDDVYAAIEHINLYGRHVTLVFFLIRNLLKHIFLSFIFLCSISNYIYNSALQMGLDGNLSPFSPLWQFTYWFHHHRRSWSSWCIFTPSRQVTIEI